MKTFVISAIALLSAVGCVKAQENWYATNGTDPWNQNFTNEWSMDDVFNWFGWNEGNFTTWDPKEIFDDGTQFVYLEGSCEGANDLGKWMYRDHVLMEQWVAKGGRLFINCAPLGGAMEHDWYFGGVINHYYGFFKQASTLSAIDANHPIWNGPFLPAGLEYEGNGTANGYITGGGVTNLAVDPGTGRVLLAELKWGDGLVLFGGLTTWGWWYSDEAEARWVRSNMISYLVNYAPNRCYPDFDADGDLTLFDFLQYVNEFNSAEDRADCTEDGAFDLFDFLCFLNAFNAGC